MCKKCKLPNVIKTLISSLYCVYVIKKYNLEVELM